MRYTGHHDTLASYDMPETGDNNKISNATLLASDEPPPFKVLNAESPAPLLLLCDHASRRFPASLGTMGLDPAARRCHLALDIGAGALTERLAESLSATAVLAQYSRLIMDCNRQLLDPGAFLEFGDGVLVPGNHNLTRVQKQRRADEIYWPYHYTIETEIQRLTAQGCPPCVIAIHSFTPVLNGVFRPWKIGVLWDKDKRIADIMLRSFAAAGYLVGDNEPYSGKALQDFTIDHHAELAGLPHVGIEIRQDLIDDEEGVAEIATLMHDIIAGVPDKIYATNIKTGNRQIPA